MHVAEAKTTTSANKTIQKKRRPFFSKEGQNGLFSESNENTRSFFSTNTIQPKLTIGQPNDKYEAEADAMADKVVQRLSTPEKVHPKSLDTDSRPVPDIQSKCAECEKEEKLQKMEDPLTRKLTSIQRKPIFESEGALQGNHVQTKSIPSPIVQKECNSCEAEERLQKKEDELSEKETDLQRKLKTSESPEPPEKDDTVQSKSDGLSIGSPDLEDRLNSSKHGGSRMSSELQNSMGSAFGSDFSSVRVHTGSQAVQMNKELNAQAFTHGSDIYFNQGKYNPESTSGKHLLAHELTHTVQQGGGVNKIQTQVRYFGPGRLGIPQNWSRRVSNASSISDRYHLVREAVGQGATVLNRSVQSAGDASPDPSHLLPFSPGNKINYDDNLSTKRSPVNRRSLRTNAGYTLHSGNRDYIVLGRKSLKSNNFHHTKVILNHEFDHIGQRIAGSRLAYTESELDAWTSTFIREFHRTYVLGDTGRTCYVQSVNQFAPLLMYYSNSRSRQAKARAVRRIRAYCISTLRNHAANHRVFKYWIHRSMARSNNPSLAERLNNTLGLNINGSTGLGTTRHFPCTDIANVSYPTPPSLNVPTVPAGRRRTIRRKRNGINRTHQNFHSVSNKIQNLTPTPLAGKALQKKPEVAYHEHTTPNTATDFDQKASVIGFNIPALVKWDKSPKLRLRSEPDTSNTENIIELLSFNEKLTIKSIENGGWYKVKTLNGNIGYISQIYVAQNLPDPEARLHRVQSGLLGYAFSIAAKYYQHLVIGRIDIRHYINVLAKVNLGKTLEGDWKKVQFTTNQFIWIPGAHYAQHLIASHKNLNLASSIIDDYTSWHGGLDESGLGKYLFQLANTSPEFFNTILDVIRKLDSGDRDEVSYHFVKHAGKKIDKNSDITFTYLDKYLAQGGKQLVDRMYTSMSTDWISDDDEKGSLAILEAKMRAMPVGKVLEQIETPLIFPLKQMGITVMDDATLNAKMVDGKIVVDYPTRVCNTSKFNDDLNTLRHLGNPCLSQIKLDPNQVVGVKIYDQGKVVRYVPASGLLLYSNLTNTSTIVKIGEVSSLAIGGFGGFALKGAGWFARAVVWADRIAEAIGIIAMIVNEHVDWIVENFGAWGRDFITIMNKVNLIASLYGVGRLVTGVGFASVTAARSKWNACKVYAPGPAASKVGKQIDNATHELVNGANKGKLELLQEGGKRPYRNIPDDDLNKMMSTGDKLARAEDIQRQILKKHPTESSFLNHTKNTDSPNQVISDARIELELAQRNGWREVPKSGAKHAEEIAYNGHVWKRNKDSNSWCRYSNNEHCFPFIGDGPEFRLRTVYDQDDLAKMKTATRRETTRLENLSDTNLDVEAFIPRPLHEFQEWFDALTPAEFQRLWANPKAKEVIAARVRAPGNLHEWLKVSQLPKLKQWGIQMEDIQEFRTLTERTVGRSFRHGGTGSSTMHNALDEMFNTSSTYKQFLRKLNDWSDIQLPAGRNSLPNGLQISPTE